MRFNRKYYNIKTKTTDGLVFDSHKEAQRWEQLLLLQKAGKIVELQRQVEFELLPAQYEEYETGELFKKGALKGQPKVKRLCVERPCVYVADFTYYTEDGEYVAEDTKGYKGGTAYDIFVIKRKLMRLIHGIKVREV